MSLFETLRRRIARLGRSLEPGAAAGAALQSDDAGNRPDAVGVATALGEIEREGSEGDGESEG